MESIFCPPLPVSFHSLGKFHVSAVCLAGSPLLLLTASWSPHCLVCSSLASQTTFNLLSYAFSSLIILKHWFKGYQWTLLFPTRSCLFFQLKTSQDWRRFFFWHCPQYLSIPVVSHFLLTVPGFRLHASFSPPDSWCRSSLKLSPALLIYTLCFLSRISLFKSHSPSCSAGRSSLCFNL